MIEFTVLELTLIVMCIGLFVYGMHYRSKSIGMFHLVSAMCRDDTVFKKVKQAHDLREEV